MRSYQKIILVIEMPPSNIFCHLLQEKASFRNLNQKFNKEMIKRGATRRET